MIPVLMTTTFNALIFEGMKIENVISNERFKNNFWIEIAPINSVGKVNKINFQQIKTFVSEFFVQLEKKQEYFKNISTANLLINFIQGSGELLSFAPSKISVELTSSQSIFLFSVKDEKNIYLEIFFDEATGNFSEAVVNIYENKIQKLAVNGSIAKVAKEIGVYLKPITTINYYKYLEESYAVSGNLTPANSF